MIGKLVAYFVAWAVIIILYMLGGFDANAQPTIPAADGVLVVNEAGRVGIIIVPERANLEAMWCGMKTLPILTVGRSKPGFATYISCQYFDVNTGVISEEQTVIYPKESYL